MYTIKEEGEVLINYELLKNQKIVNKIKNLTVYY